MELGRAGALVLLLWEETHFPKVVSLNPCTIYWMDIFSHLFAVMCVFEKTKINEKEAEVGPFLKKQSEGHAFRYRRQKGKRKSNV